MSDNVENSINLDLFEQFMALAHSVSEDLTLINKLLKLFLADSILTNVKFQHTVL